MNARNAIGTTIALIAALTIGAAGQHLLTRTKIQVTPDTSREQRKFVRALRDRLVECDHLDKPPQFDYGEGAYCINFNLNKEAFSICHRDDKVWARAYLKTHEGDTP